MSDLRGKVAVVTGASKGIGAAIAKGLSAAGAAVVVNCSSSKEGADRVVADIKTKGGKAIAIKGDVAKAADVRRLFEETKKAFARLDVLVNNPGVYKFLPLEEITEDEFRREFNINVLGTILATKEAVKHFGPNGGSVINISSIASAGEAGRDLFRDERRGRCNNTRARRGVGSAKNPGQRYCAGRRRDRGHAQRRHHGQHFREGDDRRHAAWSHRTAGRYRPRRRLPRVRGFCVAHRRAAYGVRRLPVTLVAAC
jgi:NAD(P)-dependent dehydrogenase (short-subunit alcohol dehydrogenase family)